MSVVLWVLSLVLWAPQASDLVRIQLLCGWTSWRKNVSFASVLKNRRFADTSGNIPDPPWRSLLGCMLLLGGVEWTHCCCQRVSQEGRWTADSIKRVQLLLLLPELTDNTATHLSRYGIVFKKSSKLWWQTIRKTRCLKTGLLDFQPLIKAGQ